MNSILRYFDYIAILFGGKTSTYATPNTKSAEGITTRNDIRQLQYDYEFDQQS